MRDTAYLERVDNDVVSAPRQHNWWFWCICDGRWRWNRRRHITSSCGAKNKLEEINDLKPGFSAITSLEDNLAEDDKQCMTRAAIKY